jgi:pyridoxal phosphate enzyme (YggS family)
MARSPDHISDRIARIRERIEAAARRSERSPDDVALMAVSKTVPPEKILEAYQAGIRLFGENRVQEFAAKHAAIAGPEGASFVLIGTLQSNKVNKAVELFSAIHSVDSLRLLERINAAVERAGHPPLPVAIEINTGDPAKAGIMPGSRELDELLEGAQHHVHLRIQGLMTMPPFSEDPEGARPYFRKLRELREQIAARNLPKLGMELLSMGMSHDFEVAIEEGSTCVRIGTAIFGERT